MHQLIDNLAARLTYAINSLPAEIRSWNDYIRSVLAMETFTRTNWAQLMELCTAIDDEQNPILLMFNMAECEQVRRQAAFVRSRVLSNQHLDCASLRAGMVLATGYDTLELVSEVTPTHNGMYIVVVANGSMPPLRNGDGTVVGVADERMLLYPVAEAADAYRLLADWYDANPVPAWEPTA